MALRSRPERLYHCIHRIFIFATNQLSMTYVIIDGWKSKDGLIVPGPPVKLTSNTVVEFVLLLGDSSGPGELRGVRTLPLRTDLERIHPRLNDVRALPVLYCA